MLYLSWDKGSIYLGIVKTLMPDSLSVHPSWDRLGEFLKVWASGLYHWWINAALELPLTPVEDSPSSLL